MGLVIVTTSHMLAVGDSYSFGRATVLMALCGMVIAYGFFRNPYAPFYCYAFVNPLFPAFGTNIALILGSFLLVLSRAEQLKWRWSYSNAGLAFCLWSIASLGWAEHVDCGWTGFLALVLGPMIMSFIIAGLHDKAFAKNLVFMILTACLIGSAATFWTWYSGKVTDFTGNGRVDSLIRPDIFAGWTVFGFLGALAWVLSGEASAKLRWLLVPSAGVVVIGMGLSGFRSSIVVAGLGLFAVAVIQKRFCRGVLVVCLVVVIAIATNAVQPELFRPVLARFMTMKEDRGSERLDVWESALAVFPEKPIVGTGWDGFLTASERYFRHQVASHSVYIGALVELGIVGFSLLLAWFAILLSKAWRAENRLWIFPLLLAYEVQGLLLHEFNFPFFWIVIGLVEGANPAPRRALHAVLGRKSANESPTRRWLQFHYRFPKKG
jgi:hypothetical protein